MGTIASTNLALSRAPRSHVMLPTRAVCVANKHGVILVLTVQGNILAYARTDGTLLRTLYSTDAVVSAMCVAGDGDSVMIAHTSPHSYVQVCRITDGAPIRSFGWTDLPPTEHLDCNDTFLVAAGKEGTLTVLSQHDGDVLARRRCEAYITAAKVLPQNAGILVLIAHRIDVYTRDAVLVKCIPIFAARRVQPVAIPACNIRSLCYARAETRKGGGRGTVVYINDAGTCCALVYASGSPTGLAQALCIASDPGSGHPLLTEQTEKPGWQYVQTLPDDGAVRHTSKGFAVFHGLKMRMWWIVACIRSSNDCRDV